LALAKCHTESCQDRLGGALRAFCVVFLVSLLPHATTAQDKKAATKEAGGEVTLMNCSSRAVTVKAYNSNDAEMVVPTQTSAVASGLNLTFQCATKTCKLVFNLSRRLETTPQSSFVILKDGAVTASDAHTVAKGCK